MIALAIIGAVTVITVISLGVANAIDKRNPDPKRASILARREALTRQRSSYLGAAEASENSREQRGMMFEAVRDTDRQLLALADEEAKL